MFLNKGKNYIINGAFDYWQRGISFAAAATNIYSADRFKYTKIGTMVHTISKETVIVPTFAESGIINAVAYRIQLTTAQASIAAGDVCNIRHHIEGSLFAPLAGKKFTLSFWALANATGQYSVTFRNSSLTRSYIVPYTINQASTWEKKTITVQHDTSGTWDYANATGLEVGFTVASGTTFHAPTANQWVDGNYIASSGQINGVAAGASNFRIAGIMLEEGETASNFERAGGNTMNELSLCQRYYEKSYDLAVTPTTITPSSFAGSYGTGGALEVHFEFKMVKRVIPSTLIYSPVTGAVGNARNESGANDKTVGAIPYTSGCRVQEGAAGTASGRCSWHWTADAEL